MNQDIFIAPSWVDNISNKSVLLCVKRLGVADRQRPIIEWSFQRPPCAKGKRAISQRYENLGQPKGLLDQLPAMLQQLLRPFAIKSSYHGYGLFMREV